MMIMITRKIFYVTAAAAMLLTGCSGEDATVDENNGKGPVPITLTSKILDATATRAATDLNETKLTEGDVAVFLSNALGTKYTYTVFADGSLAAIGEQAYYPTDGSAIGVVAVYPAAKFTTASGNTVFTVEAD